jgi:hypothetical protein
MLEVVYKTREESTRCKAMESTLDLELSLIQSPSTLILAAQILCRRWSCRLMQGIYLGRMYISQWHQGQSRPEWVWCRHASARRTPVIQLNLLSRTVGITSANKAASAP